MKTWVICFDDGRMQIDADGFEIHPSGALQMVRVAENGLVETVYCSSAWRSIYPEGMHLRWTPHNRSRWVELTGLNELYA